MGYTSYPDNVIVRFVQLAAEAGIDVFRIFDCFNSVEQMKVCIGAVRECNKVAEVCMCFTGDFLKESEKIYTLDYWSELAKTLVDAGAHMIAIKDMAGLFKPGHKAHDGGHTQGLHLPVHFHTLPAESALPAASPWRKWMRHYRLCHGKPSENTSQPNLNAFLATLTGGPEYRNPMGDTRTTRRY